MFFFRSAFVLLLTPYFSDSFVWIKFLTTSGLSSRFSCRGVFWTSSFFSVAIMASPAKNKVVPLAAEPPPPVTDMKRVMSFVESKPKFSEETSTHHGYRPHEWKQCYNRVTQNTFWVHFDRGTISHHDPSVLKPDSSDPDMVAAYDKAFKKRENSKQSKRVANEARLREIRENELKGPGLCWRCFNCFFIFGCPCLFALEAVLDAKTAKEQCQIVFPPIKGKVSEQSLGIMVLLGCCMPCYFLANGNPLQ